jgi:hypothetical protein
MTGQADFPLALLLQRYTHRRRHLPQTNQQDVNQTL